MVTWNEPNAESSVENSQWSPRAGDIMQCGVVSVSQEESVYTAIGILVDKQLTGLPVIHQGELAGIISEKDVLRVLHESNHLTGRVFDYMTEKVVSFDIEDSLEDIGLTLVDSSFRRVAILREGTLCGVISRSDLIRHYVSAHRAAGSQHTGGREDQGQMPQVKDIMKCGLLTVGRQTTLTETADILASKGVTGLPVVDEGMHLQGIVSEKDVLRRLFDPNATGCLVNDIMTEDVISFLHTDSIYDVCSCLINNEFRRVPIVDNGRLVGIVSRSDLVMFILKNKSAVIRGMAQC